MHFAGGLWRPSTNAARWREQGHRRADGHHLARIARLFAHEPDVGLVQLRVDSREGGTGPRDWVPRLRAGTRERTGEITLVWEGAVAMPRRVFEEVGGWPGEFEFVHEGVDLAWRVMDAGYRVLYLGDLAVLHPLPVPAPTRWRDVPDRRLD